MSNIKTATEEYFERENRKHKSALWGQVAAQVDEEPKNSAGLEPDTVKKALTPRPALTPEEQAKKEAEEKAAEESKRKARNAAAWGRVNEELCLAAQNKYN